MKLIKSLLLKKFSIFDMYVNSIIKKTEAPFYKTITNKGDKTPLETNLYTNNIQIEKGLHYVTYIPPYIETTSLATHTYKSVYQFKGFLVNMESFNSLEDFMNTQFGAKSRSKIRSYSNRLNTCFNIKYVWYYGNITETNYNYLMNALETMISRRFNQRGDEHQTNKDWQHYVHTSYQLILDKKASLFVVYDNDKPIDICLNFHLDSVLINFIRAFDIDYAKFRLGYIDIYQQLAWCFENNITTFDLGAGVFSYKKQWCNVTYTFRNDIITKKSSIINRSMANLLIGLLKFKGYLITKQILKDTANANKDVANSDIVNEHTNITLTKTSKPIDKTTCTVINIEDAPYKYLRPSFYDYLYLNFEHKNSVTVLKANNQPETYYFCGTKTSVIANIN